MTENNPMLLSELLERFRGLSLDCVVTIQRGKYLTLEYPRQSQVQAFVQFPIGDKPCPPMSL
jgi:hypothetical protein